MRRVAIFVAALALAPAAHAATPSIAVHAAGPTTGAAPYHVTLTASGDAVSYHWDLGDGATADGAVVEHTYRPGTFSARVTGTGADGSTAQATVVIRSVALHLTPPKRATYGLRTTFDGRLVPAIRSSAELWFGSHRVGVGSVDRRGHVRVRARVLQPGLYELRWSGVASNAVAVRVRPRLHAAIGGTGQLHTPLVLHASVQPAGPLRIQVWRGNARVVDATYLRPVALRLGTGRAGVYRIRVAAAPRNGFAGAERTIRRDVFVPSLAMGSVGPSVRSLESRLDDLHYALRGVDGAFGEDTRDAVVAFQKLHGLPRTGQVTAVFWNLLLRAQTPAARYPGDHIEVNKTRQVLFVVRGGKVVLISHVSTGATGNTPIGRWHVYSKVPGWLPDGMFDSSFFVGAFAIHGYPSVPVYPGSHGCVRLPVWLAPRIYELDPYGTEVDIYN